MSECAASTAHFIIGVYQSSTSSWTLSRRMKAEDETLSPSELTKNTKSMYSLELLGLGGESEVTAETQNTFFPDLYFSDLLFQGLRDFIDREPSQEVNQIPAVIYFEDLNL